jgi:hypothetical protein
MLNPAYCTHFARSDVIAVVTVKKAVFWKKMSCSLVDKYQCFGGKSCFHLKHITSSCMVNMEAADSSEMLVLIYPPYNWYQVSFPGIKQQRQSIDHPAPSNAKVNERVQQYLYSPTRPAWPVLG